MNTWIELAEMADIDTPAQAYVSDEGVLQLVGVAVYPKCGEVVVNLSREDARALGRALLEWAE